MLAQVLAATPGNHAAVGAAQKPSQSHAVHLTASPLGLQASGSAAASSPQAGMLGIAAPAEVLSHLQQGVHT